MTSNSINSVPWIEKYRPRKLKDFVQSQNLINLFKNSTAKGEMTHFLFYGPPGTGKTSVILAMGREIFKEHFTTRVIEFNASDDRGINAVREKITNEAKKFVTQIVKPDGTIIPSYKIIILDEADSMTDEAQDALRVIIEQYSTTTRFCFICNYISKITDAIKSRCTAIYFKKLDDECMIDKLKEISTKESMKLSDEILSTIIDVSNGDMRKAIMLLQNLKYLYSFKKENM
nr:ATPase family [Mimivirus sp.]